MINKIHVNQHVIRKNRKDGERNPPLTVKNYKSNTYGSKVEILDDAGKVVCEVVYTPDKPLSCGAEVYVRTSSDIRISE